ncbi:MAG: hypothetical protein LUQ47_01420 [Methanotrichaceae archaeon]|nr:hypothetical protein [Methanotrichaceae archaeon]
MSYRSNIAILVFVLALLIATTIGADEKAKYSVNLATNDTLGTYLVNQTGFTLYYFAEDSSGSGISNCYGSCAEIWSPFYAEKLTAANGLNAADFTSQFRSDGRKQTSFKGWPLYFYTKDTKPGDIFGQRVNKLWFAINPDSPEFKKSSYQPTGYYPSGYSSSGGY